MTDTVAQDESLDDFLGAPPRSSRRKWVIRGAIALALLLVLLVLGRCFGGGDEIRYAMSEAKRGDLTVTVSATGNLKPVNQVDVGSEQSGLITHVYVSENDQVTKGQLLATLDTSRLLDTVQQATAQVASARAQIAQAKAQAALADATLARQENVSRLSGGRVPSKTELDSARAQAQAARASVQAAQAQLMVASSQLSTARINLSKARIVSPVTGIVLAREIEPGQTVAASLNAPVLFTIAEDLSKMEVEVAVDEADVGQVQAGQSATFTVDAFPGREFPARISRVDMGSTGSSTSSSSSSSSSASAATVVSYKAVLQVNNAQKILRPGMTATADIIASEVKNALLIPNAALRFKPTQAQSGSSITSTLMPRRRRNNAVQEVGSGPGSRQTVYTQDADGTLKTIDITIGESDGTRTAVIGGDLKAGMKVVTGQLTSGESSGAGAKRNGG
tara:strand:- start:8922 stop:10268 length:1347 start_codon:yes stop_codon:yes gene_type:complete